MDGITVAVVSAVYLSVASSKVVYFYTPYYECKALCCMRNSCLSFDVVLSSLDCYLNEEPNITADEIHIIGSDTTLNEKNTEAQQSAAAHGSCKKEEEAASGCIANPTFRLIQASFGKEDIEEENPVTDGKTTAVVKTTQKVSASSPPLFCPSSFVYQTHAASCWKIISLKRIRTRAEMYCSQLTTGGRLGVLDTYDKYRFVKQLLSTSTHMGCVHIGAKRSATGEFIWLTSVRVGKEKWCPGEPEHKNYLSLWPEEGYCLDDIGDVDMCHFVCEVDTKRK